MKAKSSAHSTVASSATSVLLAAANAARVGTTIFNNSTQILYVRLGAAASAAAFSVKIAAGAYQELDYGFKGPIYGLWAAANGDAQLEELLDHYPTPANSVAPAITGTGTVGSTLTVADGTWAAGGGPIAYSRQWKRDGDAITGAIGDTYTVQAADAGADITCTVTAMCDGLSASVTTAATAIA
jgi:hypothetical protein